MVLVLARRDSRLHLQGTVTDNNKSLLIGVWTINEIRQDNKFQKFN